MYIYIYMYIDIFAIRGRRLATTLYMPLLRFQTILRALLPQTFQGRLSRKIPRPLPSRP